jgi:hypothetical protein
MTKEEIEKELTEVIRWTTVSGDKLSRLYAIYRLTHNDNSYLCDKCPTVIRNVFNKVRIYYKKNYESK